MKTIKLGINSLEKATEQVESEVAAKNVRDYKKKMINARTIKGYEPDFVTPIETKENSPSRNSPAFRDFPPKDQVLSRDPNEDPKRPSKSSVKLPTINYRGGLRTAVQSGPEGSPLETREDSEYSYDPQMRTLANTATGVQKHRSCAKETDSKNQNNEGLCSFLKYVQLKPVKREDKSPQKNDLSMRDLKPFKIEKSSVLRISKHKASEQLEEPVIKMSKITSEKFDRSRKNNEKSEKSILSSSIKKQRRILSISQPTRSKKQKITNTYWDFCHFVCLLNKIRLPGAPTATYKAYVGKGNNSILIKNSLKSRFWWNIVDSDAEVNLFWTQCKDPKFIQTLKCYESEEADKKEEKRQKNIEFCLAREPEKNNNEAIREYTGSGLNKLLSNEEKKRLSKNQWKAEIPMGQCEYRELGNPNKIRMHNHFEFHWNISNKKALYYNLKKFYEATKENPFEYIPLTFHVQQFGDQEWNNFVEAYKGRSLELKGKDVKGKKKKEKNWWIVKPGENSNQGNGIQVFDNLDEIAELVKESGEREGGRKRSYIVQRYLMPFLYQKRKFDIRCYVLVTSVNNVMKAYWYEEGYIRTSCKQFTLKNLKNRFIHLTNDAVQKKCEDYGKFENGNKVSYSDFQRYLDNSCPERELKFYNSVYPAMMKRSADTIKSAYHSIDLRRREFSFEIFGLDFMIDEDFNTWLIEVNTNPCLELGSPLLARIIPNMVDNALRIAVDPLFPPPRDYPKTKTVALQLFETNKFTLIFNSSEEQEVLASLTKDTNLSHIVESDEEDENHDDIE